MEKFNSDLKLQSLIKRADPRKDRVEIVDATLSELHLRISPARDGRPARAVWCHVYRERRRTRIGKDGTAVRAQGRDKLGEYPTISWSEARSKLIARRDAAAGGDIKPPPPPEVKAETNISSVPKDLGELIAKYFRYRETEDSSMRRRTRRGAGKAYSLRKTTIKDDRGAFNNHVLPQWGADKDYTKIQRHEVTTLLDTAKVRRTGPIPRGEPRGGPDAARHVLVALRGMFDWAMREQYCFDPTIYATAPTPQVRDRSLDEEEICAVWRAACEEGYPGGVIYMLALLTAQRRSEVAKMEKSEIFELRGKAPLWKLPAERVNHVTSDGEGKSRRAHDLPLSPLAVQILGALPQMPGKWVFTLDGARPYGSMRLLKQRIDARVAEILGRTPAHWVLHDLRRTADTWLNKLGSKTRLTDVERVVDRGVLNHADNTSSTSPRYNRYDYVAEQRKLLDLWSKHLTKILPPPILPAFRRPEVQFRPLIMTPEEHAHATQLYRDNASYLAISKLLDRPYGTVRAAIIRELKKLGLEPRHQAAPILLEDDVLARLHAKGMTTSQIAKEIKRPYTTVDKGLRRLGVEPLHKRKQRKLLSPTECSRVMQLRAKGMNGVQIAKELERATATIYEVIKRELKNPQAELLQDAAD